MEKFNPIFFGQRLKAIRKRNGDKQADVASDTGVHLSTYSNYERGKQFPDVSFLRKFCKLYDIDASELLDTEKNRKKRQEQSSCINSELLEIIIRSLWAAMKDVDVTIPADKQVKLISYAYEQLADEWDKVKAQETIDKLFQMVV